MARNYHKLQFILLIVLISIIHVFSDVAFFTNAFTHLSPHLDVIHSLLKEDRFIAILVDSLVEKAGVLESSINLKFNVIQQLIPSPQTITNTLTTQSQILSSTLNDQITPLYANIESVVSTQKDALQDITTQSAQQLSLLQPKLFDLADQTISTFSTVTTKINQILITDFYESNIVSKYKEISNNLVDSFYKVLEADPRLKLSTNEYVTLVFNDDIKPKIQSALLSLYDSLIESDPRLKLSTTEYVKLAIKDDIQPKVEATLDFLNRSPLAQNIRSTLTRPTDEVVYEVSQTVAQKLSPVTDILSTIRNRLVQKVSEPVVSVTQSIGNSFDAVLDTLSQQLSSSDGTVNVDGVINNLNINSATDSVVSSLTNALPPATVVNEKIIQSLQTVANEVFPRLALASNTFGTELAKSGDKLSGNIDVLLDTTGNAVTILGQNLIATPEKIANFVSNLATTRATFTPSDASSTINVVETRTAVDYLQPLLSTINDVTDKAKNWQCFTDENHWENGYWEQQITKIAKTVQELDEEKINTWGQQIQLTLDQAGQRFIEKSGKPIEKYNQFVEALNTFNNNIEPNILLFQSKFQIGLNNIEQNWNLLNNQLNQLQQQLSKSVDDINQLLPSSITLPNLSSLPTITSSSNIGSSNSQILLSSSSLSSATKLTSSVNTQLLLPISSSLNQMLLQIKQEIQGSSQLLLSDLKTYSNTMIMEGDI